MFFTLLANCTKISTGFQAPNLKDRREAINTSSAFQSCESPAADGKTVPPPSAPENENTFFGAAFDASLGRTGGTTTFKNEPARTIEEIMSDDSSCSNSSREDNSVSTEDEEGGEDIISESSCESSSSSVDSLDVFSLSLSSPKEGAGVGVGDKKTPSSGRKKSATKVNKHNNVDCIHLNVENTDVDRDVYAPQVFLSGRRRVAVMTVWFPAQYNEEDITALITDGGKSLTITFSPPRDFLSPPALAASNVSSVSGCRLGEVYGVFYDELPKNFIKKMVFDLPFQAEESLCPEALGKHVHDSGIEIVDVDLGGGRVARQIILAVREILSDDQKKEVVGRRLFAVRNQQQQSHPFVPSRPEHMGKNVNMQQPHAYYSQQHPQHPPPQSYQQHQQHENNHQEQTSGRVRPFEEIALVGDISIHTADTL